MKSKLSPARVLALGFLGLILIGTILLLLPFSTNGGCSIEDAIFTATSAVCVTGLIVKDTPVDFTLFGQLVIMSLIQVGGLGYMTSATIIPILVGRKIGLGDRVLMKEALNVLTVEGVVRFTKTVIKVTILFEVAGAVFLAFRFSKDMSVPRAIYYGIFHAISAFNNAGFALFSNSLADYRNSLSVNAAVCVLVIVGGIGFFVISDVYRYFNKEVNQLALHTKMALATTGILLAIGTVAFFVFEYNYACEIYCKSFGERLLTSFFYSFTSRTAGFSTVDFSVLRVDTLMLIMMLMFIGAAPGSTGGGVKVTTFATIVLSLWTTIRGKNDVTAFKRRLGESTVHRAFTIVVLSLAYIVTVAMLLTYFEDSSMLAKYLFEVVSAFGVVGLSLGDGGARSLSALFSPTGKMIIAVTMFAGRLGPLTLAFAMLKGEKERYRYPEGKVIIG